MLVSIYNVSPKSWHTLRDLWPRNGWDPFAQCDPPLGGHYVATIKVATCLVENWMVPFAEYIAVEHRNAFQWAGQPLKLSLRARGSGSYQIRPPSNQPFLQGSRTWPTDRQAYGHTDRPHNFVCSIKLRNNNKTRRWVAPLKGSQGLANLNVFFCEVIVIIWQTRQQVLIGCQSQSISHHLV